VLDLDEQRKYPFLVLYLSNGPDVLREMNSFLDKLPMKDSMCSC
jgi:hypothetical protein